MSGNPYEEDKMVDPDAANADLLADLEKAAGNRDDEVLDSTDDQDTFEVGAPVEDEDAEPGETPRQAKKRLRREKYLDEQRESRDENARLREEMAEMRGRMDAMAQQRTTQEPQRDVRDAYEDRRATVRDKRAENMRDYQAAARVAASESRELSEDEKRRYLSKNDEYQTALNKIDYDSFKAHDDTPQKRHRNRLVAMAPDVMDGGDAEAYAQRVYANMKDRGEITNEEEAIKQAFEKTRRERKMGKYSHSPEANEKQKTSYGNRRSTGDKRQAGKKQMVFDSKTKGLALEFYKHQTEWSDAQKMQKFANEMAED